MDEAAGPGLLDLPTDVLTFFLAGVRDFRDVLSVRGTCHRLRSAADERLVWEERLWKEAGLKLQGEGGRQPQWREAYLAVKRHEAEACIAATGEPTGEVRAPARFRALLTDGGVDSQNGVFWADNAMVPNAWDVFCSRRGTRVGLLGVLPPPGREVCEHDDRNRRMRWFMEECCRGIVQGLMQDGPNGPEGINIQEWSMSELEALFVELTQGLIDVDAEQFFGTAVGHLMAEPFLSSRGETTDVTTIYRELHLECVRVCTEVSMRVSTKGFSVWPQLMYGPSSPAPDDWPRTARHLPVPQGSTEPPLDVVCDAEVARLCWDAGLGRRVAVARSVCLSRQGNLTCPVRDGIILTGHTRPQEGNAPPSPASRDAWLFFPPPQEEMRPLWGLARQGQQALDAAWPDGLREAKTALDVLKLVAEGKLPPVAAQGSHRAGVYVEFEDVGGGVRAGATANGQNASAASEWDLRPLLWFSFRSAEELQAFDDEQRRAGLLPGPPDSATAANTPAADLTGRHTLNIELSSPRAAGAVAVLLSSPENLMWATGDTHPEPNIDLCRMTLQGFTVELPEGTRPA
ncbi:unnamed protein product [Pedinophyceae sp. YPF-701]|nr:unnamed protein product [Pedinophyceae sp. YPF-701]